MFRALSRKIPLQLIALSDPSSFDGQLFPGAFASLKFWGYFLFSMSSYHFRPEKQFLLLIEVQQYSI